MTNDENDSLKSFVEAYRANLEEQQKAFDRQVKDIESQYVTANQNIDNTRRNQFQNIMSSANARGMLYSNFPERAKVQYDTSVYKPAQIAARQSYETGLQKLRDNAVNLSNQIASINEAIADFNKIAADNRKTDDDNNKTNGNKDGSGDGDGNGSGDGDETGNGDNKPNNTSSIWTPTMNDSNDVMHYGLYELRRNPGETDEQWRSRSLNWLNQMKFKRGEFVPPAK